MARSNNTHKLIGFALIIIMVVVYVLVLKPMRQNLVQSQAKSASVKSELSILKSDLNDLQSLASDDAESTASRDALLEAIPIGLNQDSIIADLNGFAKDSKMQMNSITFSNLGDRDKIKSVGITGNFLGTYNRLITFIEAIEQSDREYSIVGMNVQVDANPGVDQEVSFTLSLETFYQ